MSDKQRWRADIARKVAEDLTVEMAPRCNHIEIAGSLRRSKPDVGDIEILFAPRIDQVRVPSELFPKFGSLADELLEQRLAKGVITKRFNVNGTTTWGNLNKLALHNGSSIPIDFFATTAERWFVSLVVRTRLGRDEHEVGQPRAAARDAAARLRRIRRHKDGRADRPAIGARGVRTSRRAVSRTGGTIES
jgi:DNA polymerase/3'-5' exonuclease PolX